MKADKINSMNLHYSIYGNPYREFVKGALISHEDGGQVRGIKIPVDIGHSASSLDDLFVDPWLGLKRNIVFGARNVVTLRSPHRQYHFLYRSQTRNVAGREWTSGPLANKFYGDLVVIATTQNQRLVDIGMGDYLDIKNLVNGSLLKGMSKYQFPRQLSDIKWKFIPGFYDKYGHITGDHVYEISVASSFESLVRMSKLSKSFRRAAQHSIRLRIGFFMAPFVVQEILADVLTEITHQRCAIVGAVPTSVFTSLGVEDDWKPDVLTVVTPKGAADQVASYLEQLHLQSEFQLQWTTVRKSEIQGSSAFIQICRLSNGVRFIDIYECRYSNVVHGILSMPHTGCNANELISFYPKLTLSGLISVVPWAPKEGFLSKEEGIAGSGLGVLASQLQRPCGKECPMMWRSTKDLDGIGIFNWQGMENHKSSSYSFSDFISRSNLKWRIGLKCCNQFCATCGIRSEWY
ncbi:hypothetical protein C8J56DRAFT_1041981 [Mycena floridula]|nr:hypothetical protein C8J56DRAFT_1041981 [Mycena floridula]